MEWRIVHECLVAHYTALGVNAMLLLTVDLGECPKG